MTTTTNPMDIPFNKLVLWDGNVRKTGAKAALDELAASIEAHGLLNPLTVRKAARGRFAVIAGQRRYLAIRRLIEAGTMDKAVPVSCAVRSGAEDGAELSLAENVVRVAMHPADQFEAWHRLVEAGAEVEAIARRFGVAESTVRKRLALARVSPRLFALYREEAIGLEALQAFTVTDDHALQEQVWDGLSEWQRADARAIRRALTATDVPRHDRRVRFVGLDAYEEAGGAVRRDLFDAEEGGTLRDAALLDALARQKLDAIAQGLRAEGWKWTEARLSFGWEDSRAFLRADAEAVELPDARREEVDQLQAELEGLAEADADDEEAQAAMQERMDAIEARLAEIDDMTRFWPDAVKAMAGAVVSLSYDGRVEVERGLVREEDTPALEGEGPAGDGNAGGGSEAQSAPPGLPAALLEELTAQKTAALRIALARAPNAALALVVHALASSTFYHGGHGVLKVWMTCRSLRPSIRARDETPAVVALTAERDRIAEMLPASRGDLVAWCFEAPRETLLDVLAVAAAHGLDAVVGKADPNRQGMEEGAALTDALGLAMARWYRPTAEGYFSRISKAAILADLEAARQAPPAPSWAKMKKSELAALAEREVAASDWLPAILR